MSQPYSIMAPLAFFFSQKMKDMWCTVFWLVGVQRMVTQGEPFVMMKDMPPGYPSLLRPENTKNATPKAMERALDHLKSRLTGIDIK